MSQQNRLFWLSVLVVFAVGVGWGYSQPTPRAWAAPAHSVSHPPSVSPVMIAPAAVIQGQGSCNPEVFIESIKRVEIGTVTESFVVSWTAPSACINKIEVSLLVTRADGSQRDEKREFTRGQGIATSALFKLAGKRDDNLTKTAKAVVRATGVLAAKNKAPKALNTVTAPPAGNGTGSNNSTPVPTYVLQGSVINTQDGTPLAGVKLTFNIVGPLSRTISVETDSQGRWQQGGFPVGKQVRVTAFKRFFVIEPAERLVNEGGLVQFTGRPANVGGTPKPTPAQTFSAGGQAKVNSVSQGTQTPLPGATISFKLLNAKPGQANVPGPVTTGKDGKWSQSGFTVGSFTYQATISKPGVTFGFATANFGSSTGATVGDVGFLGTVK